MLSVQIAVHMMVFTTWQTIRNCPAGQDGADVVEPVNRYIANNIYTVLSTVQLVRTALMWWSRSTGKANNIYTVYTGIANNIFSNVHCTVLYTVNSITGIQLTLYTVRFSSGYT